MSHPPPGSPPSSKRILGLFTALLLGFAAFGVIDSSPTLAFVLFGFGALVFALSMG